ncbi:MAG: hypothetical protein GNW80_16300 [Asgard group archaeon]|nr:hypothetical protein [Asgard group archaeon]
MMRNRGKAVVCLFFVIFSLNLIICNLHETESIEPIFTLVAKTNGGGVRPDYLHFLKQHLARIGIYVDIIVQDWPTFVGELITFRDFDICYVELEGKGIDPDFTGVYNENGSLNLFGYHTSMDWDEELKTGINEWYIKQGTLMMPSYSEERVQHYWAWQQYFMDKICPMAPAYSPKEYVTHWSQLNNYDFASGLLQSWGKMDWIQPHEGQVSTDEVVIADAAWSDLNPLFLEDSSSSFISDACLDPLIWYDHDNIMYPHLAKSYEMINETQIRITVRQGIKWGDDPGDQFTNEYLDIKDVYFTLYSLKYLSNKQQQYNWINNMQILDQWTMDIFIDGDPSTPEKEQYAPFLSSLNTQIIPEHFLNQTHLSDGVTPDITHPSWNTFATNCFGTGLFEISNFTEGVETLLAVKPDSWRLDPVVTIDPALNWTERFGFGTDWDGMHNIRIRIIPDQQTQLLEFEAGKIDLLPITWDPDKRDEYIADPDFAIQSDTTYSFSFFGFNMREVRPIIGNRAPAPLDPTVSIGLCVRKAIVYALDRFEINNVIHRGEYSICDNPIYPKLGLWNNPNIICYNFSIDKARYYMTIAGYDGFRIPPRPSYPGRMVFSITITALNSTIGVTAILYVSIRGARKAWQRKKTGEFVKE